ncbi:hypothetical protein I4U23_001523 [Adineta vaga]|nr:hypothetical protein I4U23_001523 [Adineta vaga]
MTTDNVICSYILEKLPDEILLEIFEFIDLNDLIHGFFNLNYRLNSLLFSSNIHQHILYPDHIQDGKIPEKFLSRLFNKQKLITRLRFIDNRYIINENLINYSHIHSLIIDIPTIKLIQMINPETFPRLEYFHMNYSTAKTELHKLHQKIFSNAFPLLKKCSLNNVDDSELWTGSPSLKSLGIWSNNPCTIFKRISSVLMFLRVFELFLNWPLTYVILNDSSIFQHSCLKHIKLHLNGHWTYDKLDYCFSYIPTVEHLRLYTSYFDAITMDFLWNFQKLAFIFSSRLPKLISFHCDLISNQEEQIDFEKLHSFHICFKHIKYEKYVVDESVIRIFTEN